MSANRLRNKTNFKETLKYRLIFFAHHTKKFIIVKKQLWKHILFMYSHIQNVTTFAGFAIFWVRLLENLNSNCHTGTDIKILF